MRLALSNIAWRVDEDEAMARLLAAAGVDAVEVAPTRHWPQPLEATDSELDDLRRFWIGRGLEIVSMQALLFGRPDLTLFDSAEVRARTVEYLNGMMRLAARLGARRLVFGSPNNRRVGQRNPIECYEIAVEVFVQLGHAATQEGVIMCIEPNPPAYGCDFVTTAAEGLRLVRDVANEGFGLHLDAGGLWMAGDDPAAAVRMSADAVKHVHLSAPQLGPLNRDAPVDYAGVVAALRETHYRGVVAVEMRAQSANGDHRPSVAEAVGFVRGLLAQSSVAG